MTSKMDFWEGIRGRKNTNSEWRNVTRNGAENDVRNVGNFFAISMTSQVQTRIINTTECTEYLSIIESSPKLHFLTNNRFSLTI